MKIVEEQKTVHEIINIHYKTADDEIHEEWVDIHKNKDGEVMTVTIGRTEISAFELQILEFLQKKGKLFKD